MQVFLLLLIYPSSAFLGSCDKAWDSFELTSFCLSLYDTSKIQVWDYNQFPKCNYSSMTFKSFVIFVENITEF